MKAVVAAALRVRVIIRTNVLGRVTMRLAGLSRREGAWIAGVAVVGWIVVFGRLGYPSLLDPDEAHYAQLTREMMRARSWFVPLLDGSPYIDKPVLFHWLQMACVSLFGESEFAFRLPSAAAGILLVFITRWLGVRMFGRATGNAAALMFATMPFTFALANVALFDMVYTAFLFGGVASLIAAATQPQPRLQYLGYLFLTLAVMTKGPVALALVIMWAAATVGVSPALKQAARHLQWRTGLLMIVVCASPWFVYMWVTFNGQFVHDYLLAGNLWYFTGPKVFSSRASDHTFYLRTFAGAFFPWSAIAVGYACDRWTLRRARVGWAPHPGDTALVVWIVVMLSFFSIARFKLDWYIFPAAPACCLLAARGWHAAHEIGRWTRVAILLTALTFLAGGAVATVAVSQLDLQIARAGLVLPLALMCGGGVLLLQLVHIRFGRAPTVAIPVGTLIVVYAAVVLLGLPVLERSRPTAPIGRWVKRHTQPGTVIGVYGLTDWRSSIRYYADRPLIALTDAIEVRRFFDAHPSTYVMMLRSDYDALREAGVAIVEVGRRRAIVDRTGKYLRRQVWGALMVVTSRANGPSLASTDLFTDESR